MKNSVKLIAFSLFFVFISCGSVKTKEVVEPIVEFNVDLLDRSDDTFKVVVIAPELKEQNNIFQFASSAPGTYQVMDIGRFVRSFKAYDINGVEIKTEKINTNQYQLSTPEKISKIEYSIAETWDTKVEEHPIYLMAGTSIENDHTLINGQAVFGYFKGKQAYPIKVKINYPSEWLVGTALKKSKEDYYLANNYDHIVDSPILLGNLTSATMDVQGTSVDVYTYSKTGMVKSQEVLESMSEMLNSASSFVNGLPVKHYTFLFHFEDVSAGAWEHSYSSEYISKEDDWDNLEKDILDTAAHEFFHVITPLNIHSEIIQEFNFITPIASRHLWLYEGTTEWASHMMLFQSGQKSLNDYLKMLHDKILLSKNLYDEEYSILDLALNSYTAEGQKQYGNIYMRGSLVAGLLDIKLLELSNGKKGLKEVVNELAQKYGPYKPFKDDSFFDEFTKMTYPEIGSFFEKYVKNAKPLPFKEYYHKIGIDYFDKIVDDTKSGIDFNYYPIPQGLYILADSKDTTFSEFKKGDFILSINGEAANVNTISDLLSNLEKQKIGSSYKVNFVRKGKKADAEFKTSPKTQKFVFQVNENANDKQLKLRKSWMD